MKTFLSILLLVIVASKANGQIDSILQAKQKADEAFLQKNTIHAHSPLFILDDKEIDREKLAKIKPDDIAEVLVLKDSSATSLYGEKGKGGVVIIKLKNTKPPASNLKSSQQ